MTSMPTERSFALPVGLLLGAWVLAVLALSQAFFPGGIAPEVAQPPTWKSAVAVGLLALGALTLAWLGFRALTKRGGEVSGA